MYISKLLKSSTTDSPIAKQTHGGEKTPMATNSKNNDSNQIKVQI
jgi:hypothetical protein